MDNEQKRFNRLTLAANVVALVFAALALVPVYQQYLHGLLYHCLPCSVPVGATWEKNWLHGGGDVEGVGRAPVQYDDKFVLVNQSASALPNVRLGVINPASGKECWADIGTIPANGEKVLSGLRMFRYPSWCASPRDVLVVRCDGYIDKRIAMKELGLEKSIREAEKEENKANSADPKFWPKYWAKLKQQKTN